jgi:dTMP kinase
MEPRGRLITIEGIDGAGKTTLAERLVTALPGATLLREPGGVAVSERVRALVKDPGLDVDPRAEALLYAAARAQLVHERLVPLLESGADVLLDRFVDSSLAYQGAGRGLGVEEIAELNRFATAGLVPDRTLYLRVPPSVGARRRDGGDRLEQEPEDFFAAIVEAYDAIARAEPARVRVIDATRSPDDVLADALHELDDLR